MTFFDVERGLRAARVRGAAEMRSFAESYDTARFGREPATQGTVRELEGAAKSLVAALGPRKARLVQ